MDGRYTRSTSSSKEDSSISIKLQQRTSVMDNHSESDTEHKPSGDGDCTSDNADNLPHAKETTDPSLIVSTQSSEEILERLEASVELPAFYSKQSQCPITLSPDHVNDVSKSSGDIEPSVISVHSLAASPIHYRCSSQLHSAPQEASVEFVGSQVKSSLDEKQGVFTVNSKVEDGSTSSPAVKVPSAVAETKPQRDRLWTTAISCIIASIPALLIGCTLGFPSVALFDLRALPPEFRLSTVLLDVFIAIAPIGAVFGGLPAGWVADKWGRKAALMLVGLPYLVGYLMVAYARFAVTRAGFISVLLLGRFLTGVGFGWATSAVSIYNAEMASARVRGIFTSFTRLYLGAGLLVVFSVGSIPGFRYYDTALVMAGIIAVFELLMVWLCETPRWVITRGKKERAGKILQFLRGSKYDFEKELADIITTVKKTPRLTTLQVLKQFKRRSVYIPVIMLLFVMFFMQISGLHATTAFGAIIFDQAGVANPNSISAYSIGIIGVVFTFCSMFIIDLVGRKILLVISGVGMFLGTTLLGVHQFITRPSLCQNATMIIQDSEVSCNTHFAPLAIFSICLFTATFAVGWGPMPWILLGELLPLQVRGMASGLAVIVAWGTTAIVTGFYVSYANLVSPWFAWWTFSVFNFAGVLFVIFGLIETKGKSLEEIQEYFESKHSRKSKNSS